MTTEVERVFEDLRQQVDAALAAALPAGDGDDPGRLKEAMRYAVLQGGKRIRPMVAIAACRAAGGEVSQALPACCGIELVHAYSLVHDDLPAMDDDRERRGKPTVHVAFGEDNAILCGDALLTLAFEVVARAGQENPKARAAEAVIRLGRHAGIEGMVGGQALDLALGQDIAELERLERVHALKTGGLYAGAAAMGALLAGAADEDVDRLERWGLAFGIAFQHADDVLDDDQPRLRDAARRRVEELTAECSDIAGRYGDRGDLLEGIAAWVAERMGAALAGEKRE
jgi:geranylgeranyl pyrophosphate synthase